MITGLVKKLYYVVDASAYGRQPSAPSEQLRQVVVSNFCELVVQYKHLGSWQGINKLWTSPIA